MASTTVQQVETNKGKQFVKSFGIYAIGEFGMKIITFLLMPLYTYYVEKPSDYGIYDFCLTICFALMPIISVRLRSGIFRFIIDNEDEEARKGYITATTLILATTVAMTLIIGFGVFHFFNSKFVVYTIVLLIIMSLLEVQSQTIRAIYTSKVYILVGFLDTFFIGVLSVIFVAFMHMGVDGIFLANIISRVTTSITFEIIKPVVRRYFSLAKFDFSIYGKTLLKFTLPLLPVSVLWWSIGFSNRLFIKEYIGLEVNGLYAVASRMITILHTIGIIFTQAWQENAFKHYHNPNRDSLFSSIFNNFMFFYTSCGVIFIFGVKLIFPILIGPSYQSAIQYVYLLTFSSLIASYSNFFDIAYQCAKETKRTVMAVFCIATSVISLDFILIKPFGVSGIILALIISYFFYFFYRFYDTKKYFRISLDKRLLIPIIILVLSAIPFYLSKSIVVNIAWLIFAILIIYIAMPQTTKRFVTDTLFAKFKRKN